MSALLLDVRVTNSPEVLGQHVAEATRLLQRGDRVGAQRIYQQVLAAIPKHPSTWSNLAALAIGLDNAEAGRAHAVRALSLAPNHVDAGVNFGVASWHTNQRRDAERAFLQALALSPGLEAPAMNLTQMWNGIGRYELATNMLDAALVHNPKSSRLQQARAENARLRGQTEAPRHHALAALATLLPTLASSKNVITASVDVAALETDREAMLMTLTTTCDRLAGAGIEHVLFGGTVLAIARDGNPFHGDKDIDLAVPLDIEPDQLASLFTDGFTLMRAPPQAADRRLWCMAWTDDATGIGVDIFLDDVRPDGTRRRCLGWPDDLYYDYPAFSVTSLHWRGRDWPVPSPLPDYLASDYGEDWVEPMRVVGGRSFDKRWLDTQISSPALAAESLPRAINLVLLRLLGALRDQQWQKALALCDQILAYEEIHQVEAVRDHLLDSGVA